MVEFWDISTKTIPMSMERVAVPHFPSLVILFNAIAWIGAYIGQTPRKSTSSVILSSAVSFLLLWDYGVGVTKARFSLITGSPTAQIDDRER